MFKCCTDRFSTYIDNVDDSRVELKKILSIFNLIRSLLDKDSGFE